MKKGKIFTNCFFVISIVLTGLSFLSCSTDDELNSIIDERVPLETDIPLTVVHSGNSIDKDTTTQSKNTTTLLISAENSNIASTPE